ncbi:MAG: DUF58 domain-containing protein [Flavobacteriales bacterium]|nr:DUF58 domain-containing protein [Flavobacteriales bacterium]
MKLLKSLYLNSRMLITVGAISAFLVISHFFQVIYPIAQITLYFFLAMLVLDLLMLYATPGRVEGARDLPEKCSLGDMNDVYVHYRSTYAFQISMTLIDELPFQLQLRNSRYHAKVLPGVPATIQYQIRPLERGQYHFGRLNFFASTQLGFFQRRFIIGEPAMVPVYPSFIQLRKFEFLAISNRLTEHGVKRIRKVGHSYEFDQIRQYVPGDDVRTLNWMATAKMQEELMVNQFMDERSQHIFSVINTGRIMKMPFNGLTLLDHAINSTLVLLNVAIRKGDNAGLVTFSDKIYSTLQASRRATQMHKIMDFLYHVSTDFAESDYERLYFHLSRVVRQRSMVLFYTNFESIYGLERALPYLKRIAKHHLLIVVFFRNTELSQLNHLEVRNTEDVYVKTMAMKFGFEKELIARELERHGIHHLLTTPEHLTVDAVNKYLEVKARALV